MDDPDENNQEDDDEEEDGDESGGDGSSKSGGVASALSPLWCRNCDHAHGDGLQTCPLRTPVAVVSDSVIDFSGEAQEPYF